MFVVEYRYVNSSFYPLTNWSDYTHPNPAAALEVIDTHFPHYGDGDSYRFRIRWED